MKREEFIQKWGLYSDGQMARDLDKLLSLPPAEGAEEILKKYPHNFFNWDSGPYYHHNDVLAAMNEHTTSHAQHLAEKIAEER